MVPRVQPGAQSGADLLRRRDCDEIVRMVERLKGGKWDTFRNGYGDSGWDLALWAGGQYAGMKLGELAAKIGGASDAAVSMAVKRLLQRSPQEKAIRQATGQCHSERM